MTDHIERYELEQRGYTARAGMTREPDGNWVLIDDCRRVVMDAALTAYANIHRCRLTKPFRGLPVGTPCDVCIEDAKFITDNLLGA